MEKSTVRFLAPIVQGIEREFPKLLILVRVQVGVQKNNQMKILARSLIILQWRCSLTVERGSHKAHTEVQLFPSPQKKLQKACFFKK